MFLKIFPKILSFSKKRIEHIQDIHKVSSCSKFQLDISENGWVSRFFIFQYTGYIILQNLNACFCMFWKSHKKTKWYH